MIADKATDKAMSLEFLQEIYCNNELPLSVRMRAAIAALPFETPKLAVSAQVSESDFASLLDRRIARFEQMKLIETPTKIEEPTNGSAVGPQIADRGFRRRI